MRSSSCRTLSPESLSTYTSASPIRPAVLLLDRETQPSRISNGAENACGIVYEAPGMKDTHEPALDVAPAAERVYQVAPGQGGSRRWRHDHAHCPDRKVPSRQVLIERPGPCLRQCAGLAVGLRSGGDQIDLHCRPAVGAGGGHNQLEGSKQRAGDESTAELPCQPGGKASVNPWPGHVQVGIGTESAHYQVPNGPADQIQINSPAARYVRTGSKNPHPVLMQKGLKSGRQARHGRSAIRARKSKRAPSL